MKNPLSITEQRALGNLLRSDPAWVERHWKDIVDERWRHTEEYIAAVRALETEEERMNREAQAFEERQLAERLAFAEAQKRRMDGGR